MTKTGVIGGIKLPSIKLTFAGIRWGFLATRPQARLLVSFTGSFDDGIRAHSYGDQER